MTQHPEHPVQHHVGATEPQRGHHQRQMRYLLSMGIRTVCFVLAIVTTGRCAGSLVAAAVFLPYVAVVLANATDRRASAGPARFVNEERACDRGRTGSTTSLDRTMPGRIASTLSGPTLDSAVSD